MSVGSINAIGEDVKFLSKVAISNSLLEFAKEPLSVGTFLPIFYTKRSKERRFLILKFNYYTFALRDIQSC